MHQDAGKVYRIVVRSELSERYAAAFEGMELETKGGLTVLRGKIVDQPQLYGVLDRLSALGLGFLSVVIRLCQANTGEAMNKSGQSADQSPPGCGGL